MEDRAHQADPLARRWRKVYLAVVVIFLFEVALLYFAGRYFS